MGSFADIVASSLIYIGLFLVFFSPNICFISGETSSSSSDLEPKFVNYNNSTSIRNLDSISISNNNSIRKIRSDGSTTPPNAKSRRSQQDSTRLPRSTTTAIPGCEPGSLQQCIKMQPAPAGHGIPATKAAVEKACRDFDSGMDCFYKWAQRCIKEQDVQKFNTSTLGANEMFTFLCRDPAFRVEYLKHSKCYQKISKRWDECAAKFIDVLQSPEINVKDESDQQICCIRLRFIQCVMQITHSKCDADDPGSAPFVRQMAETVLRSKMQGHHPEQCSQVTVEHCPTGGSLSIVPVPVVLVISVLGVIVRSRQVTEAIL